MGHDHGQGLVLIRIDEVLVADGNGPEKSHLLDEDLCSVCLVVYRKPFGLEDMKVSPPEEADQLGGVSGMVRSIDSESFGCLLWRRRTRCLLVWPTAIEAWPRDCGISRRR
jgi:hypothetical protein